MTSQPIECDVVIIGGGPGGSTTASLLRKYNPSLRVVIVEKETFPRDHVGESQLPPIGKVLKEMGAWEKVEAAGFPIKLGATYTWGKTKEPWVFGFIPTAEIGDTRRPGKYEGWRERVAFQVDRSVYDKILLEHAKELGTSVLQPSRVTKVDVDSSVDRKIIHGIELDDGRTLRAKYYIDASGNAAVLRRQLGVDVDAPSLLRNVAFWDYWEKDRLNESLLEKGTMRVMIRSVSFGWLWYIVLSERRTSVGLVCNAEYYKASGQRPEDLYHQALAQEPQISELLKHASSRGKVDATTDWSYVSNETVGANWFLVGESLGFADPILAAGLTLTHTCAAHCACTILELERGVHNADWLRNQYHEIQTRRVRQHMKFAEYWYSSNELFSAILENCSRIASESGLKLSPQDAFRWLSHGGIDDVPGQFVIGGLGLSGIKAVQKRFSHDQSGAVQYLIDGMNTFELDIDGAATVSMAIPTEGSIRKVSVLQRGDARWPITDIYGLIYEALKSNRFIEGIIISLRNSILSNFMDNATRAAAFSQAILCLEALVAQGWVKCSKTEGRAALSMETPDEGDIVYTEKLGPATK